MSNGGFRWLAILLLGSAMSSAAADETPKFSERQIEHFENKIRPLLVKRCHQCHSSTAKRLEGGLYLDSRQGALKGGDTGPAFKPGSSKESLLVEALHYQGDYKMPPKGKLPANEIKLLEDWINDGAAWTFTAPVANSKKFDLDQRRKSYWVWNSAKLRPAKAIPPEFNAWAGSPIDAYILQRVLEAGLKPAPPADRRTLIRRISFDLTGLPPTPEEVRTFVEDKTSTAFEKVVDRLLKSPRFGERWSRHWLDLVRYADSRGHEFDYNTPNAYEYRDYVIRALNLDLPYDEFVTEHIAGDLLPAPRLHPLTKSNESIIGTGFWFLGEWCHSPVDIRKDEADRINNMIDVFGKTFLGITIACARCHDHKFDAISQRDYYAMAGYLQSSAYRLARFESMEHNRDIAQKLNQIKRQYSLKIARKIVDSAEDVLHQLSKYLLAARETLLLGPDKDRRKKAAQKRADVIFEDFENGEYKDWEIAGRAFGLTPQTQKTIGKYQGNVNAVGNFFVNSHNIRMESGKRRRGDTPTGTMLSRPFKIQHQYIHFLVGGGGHKDKTCVNLVVDGKVVVTTTGKNSNQMAVASWNVQRWLGREARIQAVDDFTGGWGNIGLDHIVFSNSEPNTESKPSGPKPVYVARSRTVAKQHGLDPELLNQWVEHLLLAKADSSNPLQIWSRIAQEDELNDKQLRSRIAALSTKQLQLQWTLQAGFKNASLVIDYATSKNDEFIHDGFAFGLAPIRPGDVVLGDDLGRPIKRVALYGAATRDSAFKTIKLRSGSQNDAGKIASWVRSGQSIRTPTFTLEFDSVYYLVRGAGNAFAVVDSHRMINGPLHGNVVNRWNDDKGKLRWIGHKLSRYRGHRLHVEFSPNGGSDLEVLMVVQAKGQPGIPVVGANTSRLFKSLNELKPLTPAAIADTYQKWLVSMVGSFDLSAIGPSSKNVESRIVMNWMLTNSQLFLSPKSKESQAVDDLMRQFLEKKAALVAQIKRESRVAMAMWDGSAENEPLLIRGNHKTTGDLVPRHFLEAIAGREKLYSGSGSGRLELARSMTKPSNPLTSRVMVNRIWHHLFGRGIVASVDNLGVLGERPTHPELLDYLAIQFVRDGWSVKQLIRKIVLAQTYRMSSQPNPAGQERDPANLLLHRMRIRRLQSEPIRDSILALSGRLDTTAFGASVPVYVTEFMQGRGRPRSGPLDGGGRRSVYISIRRNFLSPMMLAFDAPQPFSSMGRRTVSNVPAQALILMNDPFVIQQAGLWSKSLLSTNGLTSTERIQKMYEAAFARLPSETETAAALAFLNEQGKRYGAQEDKRMTDQRAWADLCHVMFNVKEFIFVN